jgi:hypothetical protein
VLGEAVLALLGEEQSAVREHVELPLAAGNGPRLQAQTIRYLGRETRGPTVVTLSDGAVVDLDSCHGATLSSVVARLPGC